MKEEEQLINEIKLKIEVLKKDINEKEKVLKDLLIELEELN